MTVSVIIPTCNRPDFLMEAIESVWEQTLLPDEIIIGDDSKDDITEKLVKEKLIPVSKVPIKYFHHKPSLFQAGNVDFLIQSASKEFLLLLHDDDALLPECLEILEPPLAENPEAVASFGKQYLIDENSNYIPGGEIINENTYRVPKNAGIVEGEWAAIIGMFPNNAFLMRSLVAKQIGYEDYGRSGDAIDFFFGYRVGKGNNFLFVDQFTSKYRHTIHSISRGSDKLFSAKLAILMEDLNREKFENEEIKKTIHFLLNPAISEAINRGDKKIALRWMLSPHYNLYTLKACKRLALLLYPFKINPFNRIEVKY